MSGPEATAGSTPIFLKKIGITVPEMLESSIAAMSAMPDAARNAERHERRFAAQQKICPDERERGRAEDRAVHKSDARLLPDKLPLLRAGRFAVHKDADRDGKRLRADVARHIQHERLEAHDERELRHDALEKADDARHDHPEPQQHEQPRQTLAHALHERFVEILLRGETGEPGVVLAQRVVHRLDEALAPVTTPSSRFSSSSTGMESSE